MKKSIFLLFILLNSALYAFADAEFSIVPPRTVIAGQNFAVTFRLKNAENSSMPQPPQIEGCKLLYGPATSTMQSYQNVNGRATSSVTVEYTFTYRAEKEGEHTIPQVSVTVGRQKLSSRQATVKILPPDKSAATSGSGASGNVHIDDIDSQNSSKNVSDKDVFIRIILNKSSAYKEEAIECTMKLYTKFSSISGISAKTPPAFDGFLIEEDNSTAQVNDTEHYNGENYLTAVLKKYIIFPQKTGKLTINSGEYEITVLQYERVNMGFFTTSRPVERTVHVKPGNLSINILPLPEPAPTDFSGAVGNFTLKSDISSNSLRTNEAATLTLSVSGTGDIKYLKEIPIEFPTEFEQYTPKNDIESHISGNTVVGKSTFEYTFVPQSTGDFIIPEATFTYFNPAEKKYITLKTPEYKLKVAKGVGASSVSSTEQQNIAAKATDILHIKTGDKKQKKDISPVAYSLFYWLLYVALIVALIVVLYAYSKHIKLASDVTRMKVTKANKVARKRLKEARAFMAAKQTDKFYEELQRAIWGYLSDKLSIPASQLTRQNIADRLLSESTPQELVDRLIEFIDNCEMAHYTPGMDNNTSLEKYFDDASELINKMENIKK